MTIEERKKITLLTLRSMKLRGERAVFITAYDFPFGLFADRAGVDMILVGDSAAMTTHGHTTTMPITMDEMISHAKAVRKAVKYAFLIGDMPYMSYQPSDRDAIVNAGRFIAEAGCDAVKCEGGRRMAGRVKAMVDAGVVVMGHLGMTPQNMAQMGGYRVQGKTKESYDMLLDDALALQEAGASSLLLEAMPAETAAYIRERLSIPVYGIGAGDQVDGQLVIVHDIIGMFEQFKPKFVKRYCEVGELIEGVIRKYANEVRNKIFPSKEHFYDINADELKKICGEQEIQGRGLATQSAKEINLLNYYPCAKRNINDRFAAIATDLEARKTAKQFSKEYFDGTREQGYGGYYYDGRWIPVAKRFIEYYGLTPKSAVLDVGCGKGFLLHDLRALLPGVKVAGLDISSYAAENAMEDTKPFFTVGNAMALPYPDKSFDVVFAINVIHNLKRPEAIIALKEIMRVSRGGAYVQVDSFRNEQEKENIERWQLTAETVLDPDGWRELFAEAGYAGDYYWTITE